MPALPRVPTKIAIAVFVSVICAGLAAADDVSLRLKEGGFEVAGTLKSFDGKTYVIEAGPYGMLTLEAARFDCSGAACAQHSTPVSLAVPAPPSRGKSAAPIEPANIAIHGSAAIGTIVMPALVRAFAQSTGAALTQVSRSDPRIVTYRLLGTAGGEASTIEIDRRGSASGFNGLARGTAAIAMSDRPVNIDEAATLAALIPRIRSAESEHVLGLDGVAIITARDNPVRALNLDQIAGIFAGRITDWQQLGHAPGPIRTYAAETPSASLDVIETSVLAPRRLGLSPDATRLAGDAAVADAIAADPAGIGFVTFANVRAARSVPVASACGLTAMPSTFAVKTGEYPLTRSLYLYTQPVLEAGLTRNFLRFALSSDAQAVIADSDLVDQSFELSAETEVPRMTAASRAPAAGPDAIRMRRLTADAAAARRLSATFRFTPGSSELDAKSRQDVVRLSRHLLAPAMAGKTVFVMGFSDQLGSREPNAALSLRRASGVRAALLAAAGGRLDPRRIEVRGFGALAPVACSDTPDGLYLNRRVEIWISN